MLLTQPMPLPTVILPGYFAGAEPYAPLAQTLIERGYPTTVVPLKRWDWLPTLGGRPITPILQVLNQTVAEVLSVSGSSQINLVGHSAGGWLARIWLGDQPYGPQGDLWQGYKQTATLISLGTPHYSQERWTRSNIDFVNSTYPGSYHDSVRYICLAGKSVYGERTFNTWFAYSSYELTAGRGNCWGDGITPVECAHLHGAENLTLTEVIHSPRPGRLWYGSPPILDQWLGYLK
jgi:pimeloyl-ACP methyl ester carboxylesterase